MISVGTFVSYGIKHCICDVQHLKRYKRIFGGIPLVFNVNSVRIRISMATTNEEGVDVKRDGV